MKKHSHHLKLESKLPNSVRFNKSPRRGWENFAEREDRGRAPSTLRAGHLSQGRKGPRKSRKSGAETEDSRITGHTKES